MSNFETIPYFKVPQLIMELMCMICACYRYHQFGALEAEARPRNSTDGGENNFMLGWALWAALDCSKLINTYSRMIANDYTHMASIIICMPDQADGGMVYARTKHALHSSNRLRCVLVQKSANSACPWSFGLESTPEVKVSLITGRCVLYCLFMVCIQWLYIAQYVGTIEIWIL